MWSQIQNTELAGEAILLITQNAWNGCEYHNLLHVDEMYEYLEETNEPYDEALDWAILFHDIVYDNQPDKERRSASKFHEMQQKYRGCNLDTNGSDRVQFLIMETEKHLVTPDVYLKGSSAIIRADLHALTSKTKTVENFTKIMYESMNLYECTVEEFATNNINYMIDLYNRVNYNAETVDKTEQKFFYDVLDGINLTIDLATALEER